MAKERTELTRREEKFVEGYILKLANQREAAEYAGYRGDFYTLQRVGSVVYRRPLVRAAIRKALEDKAMPLEELLMRITSIARAEYGEYIRPDGTVDLVRMKADGKLWLVSEIQRTKHGPKVKFVDTQWALEVLIKFYGYSNEPAGEITINVQYAEEMRGEHGTDE